MVLFTLFRIFFLENYLVTLKVENIIYLQEKKKKSPFFKLSQVKKMCLTCDIKEVVFTFFFSTCLAEFLTTDVTLSG